MVRIDRLELSITASVDAPAALWPVLPGLFAGVRSLGSMPGVIVRLLRGAGVGTGDRVIDLACGKGAVAVGAASGLGCRVIGVDGAGQFVESGRALARRRGVEGLVRFVSADVRVLPRELVGKWFDAALMIGLLGLVDAGRVLRRLTKPGGVYIVDDCFQDPGRGRPARGLGGTPTMEECNEGIAGLGDVVERVEVPAPSAVARLHGRLSARLAANAVRVGRERPRLRRELREFLRSQRTATGLLSGAVRPGVWVVRRG